MPHISIISSSIRKGRKSHSVALYFENYLASHQLATTEILDLQQLDFPIFEETLKTMEAPSKQVLAFAEKIASSDGVIIVTPEYNGGYPASLKNAIDLLYEEWHHKPVGIVTVSSGPFGGSQVLVALQFTLWKMKACTIPAFFSVPAVATAYSENGESNDPMTTDALAADFLSELLMSIQANPKAS